MHSLFWLGPGTLIKSGGIKLVLRTQIAKLYTEYDWLWKDDVQYAADLSAIDTSVNIEMQLFVYI